MLFQLFWFLPLLPLSTKPPSLSQTIPTRCSCPWVVHINSLATPFPILYFTSPLLFCNYLFVLLKSTPLHPFLHTPLPSNNYQNALCNHDSVSVFLVCLVCFFDSIVDTYVFLAIWLFIVLIFFLNKSLYHFI